MNVWPKVVLVNDNYIVELYVLIYYELMNYSSIMWSLPKIYFFHVLSTSMEML